MPILRVRHEKNYTCISNTAIRDKRLSFRARGLHHLLLSYPDGWQVNSNQLTHETEHEGRDAIRKSLSELEQFGYLKREKIQDSKTGRYRTESVVYELPIGGFSGCATEDGLPGIGAPVVGNPVVGVSGSILNTDQAMTYQEVPITYPIRKDKDREGGEVGDRAPTSRALPVSFAEGQDTERSGEVMDGRIKPLRDRLEKLRAKHRNDEKVSTGDFIDLAREVTLTLHHKAPGIAVKAAIRKAAIGNLIDAFNDLIDQLELGRPAGLGLVYDVLSQHAEDQPKKSKSKQSPKEESKPVVVAEKTPDRETSEPEPPKPEFPAMVISSIEGSISPLQVIHDRRGYVSDSIGYWDLVTIEKNDGFEIVFADGRRTRDLKKFRFLSIEDAAKDQRWEIHQMS